MNTLNKILLSLAVGGAMAVNVPFLLASEKTTLRKGVTITPQAQDALTFNNTTNHFGLSKSEWTQYEAVMQSTLGWEMREKHPLVVLGRTASTQIERKQYAQRLVKHEHQVAQGLLAFARARTAAWKHLYPDLPLIADNTPERVALYVSLDCDTCSDVLQKWRSKGSKVDIYFVGGRHNDAALRQWAMKIGIRKRDVDDNYITLNHDDGSWLTVARAKSTPVSMAKNKAGVWSFVNP